MMPASSIVETRECLKSDQVKNYPSYEIIIFDNFSKDGTAPRI
jgi:glycosyltransferase involved in cell wall biosynthesis